MDGDYICLAFVSIAVLITIVVVIIEMIKDDD